MREGGRVERVTENKTRSVLCCIELLLDPHHFCCPFNYWRSLLAVFFFGGCVNLFWENVPKGLPYHAIIENEGIVVVAELCFFFLVLVGQYCIMGIVLCSH